MFKSFRSRRRSMLLSWLSVLVLVTSVFSWLPAAAQEGTPVSTPPDVPATEQLQTTQQDETLGDENLDDGSSEEMNTGDDAQDFSTTVVPIEITSVTLGCGSTGGTSLVGTFIVANPQDNISVELWLEAGGAVLRTSLVPLNAAQTEFPFDFALEADDASIGGSVVVTAREEDSDATPVASNAVDIVAGAEGGTVCGVVAAESESTDLEQSLTDESSPTPTGTVEATATADVTATSTQTPTPWPTPDSGMTDRLVELLVEILAEAIAGAPSLPPPGDPPPTSGGDSDETRTGMVNGTGGAGLRCRTAPESGDVIVVLPEGTRIETRGETSNGWAPIRCGGQDGWVSVAYVLFGTGGGTGELWIDIDLTDQYMRVYRGDTVVMETYISSGRVPKFTTPTGTFYINTKIPSQTMSGTLQGESYHVPNVPWVMYFTDRGHAIHGTYWHNNFGTPMSHGCINLPVSTAEWLYSVSSIGTRVVIHY